MDPSFGTVEFMAWRWDANKVDEGASPSADKWNNEYEVLKTRPCTLEELGLTDGEKGSTFWPINENHLFSLQRYSNLMFCADDLSKLKLKGSIQSQSGAKISAILCQCQGKPECKTPEEIHAKLHG